MSVTLTVTTIPVGEADLGEDGLATARRVVQRHGGALEVEARGDHVRFVVYLPDRLA